MKNDYENLNSRHQGSRARRQREIKKRRMIIAACAAGAVVLIGGTVFAVKTIAKQNEEPVEVAQEVEPVAEEEPPVEEDFSDVKIEVVYPEETEEEEPKEEEVKDTKKAKSDDEDASVPQTATSTEKGEEVKVAEAVESNADENGNITYGIDVSKFQGTIDWSKVAGDGVGFAMIRVGHRDSKTGEIKADPNAKYNMQEAEKNGIKIGAYFFSTAASTAEAVEEADWVANYISQYPITYPVGYNCEGFEKSTSRQYNLTKDERSNIAIAFLNEIAAKGYTPIFYASKSEMAGNTKWNASDIEPKFKIWMAWYNQDTSNLAAGPAYSGKCAMWQYTNQGTISGISGKVDVDVAYFGYNGTKSAKDKSERAVASADVEALMDFTDVNETVTSKKQTNLRDKPSQKEDSTVKVTLENGQTATRTGISKSGWSRVVYDGVTYYAVSSLLTTDLSAAPQAAATDQAQPQSSGFKTQFTDVNETITAKEIVNLRNKPSVTDGDSQVIATLYNGMTAVRTGINSDLGWSRVEYNGQVLYCVSNYVKVVQ